MSSSWLVQGCCRRTATGALSLRNSGCKTARYLLPRVRWQSSSHSDASSLLSAKPIPKKGISAATHSTSLNSADVKRISAQLEKSPAHIQLFVDSLLPSTRRRITAAAAAEELNKQQSEVQTMVQAQNGNLSKANLVNWLRDATHRLWLERGHLMTQEYSLAQKAFSKSSSKTSTPSTSASGNPKSAEEEHPWESMTPASAAHDTTSSDPAQQTPSRVQLRRLALSVGIPYVGFGFMGNTIMLIMGHAVESYIGVYLGVGALACAAIGNVFADCAGVVTGSFVQSMTLWLGFSPPTITPEQARLPVCRVVVTIGGMLGVTIGCLLGLIPLFFFDQKPPAPEPSTSSP